MATKAEVFALLSTQVTALCTSYKVEEDFQTELMEVLEEHVAPKKGGGEVDYDKVTKKDADGNVVELQCSLSGVFLPATKEYFYRETQGNMGKNTNGLKRLSKQAEAIRKQFKKQKDASEKAIANDIIKGNIEREDGAKLLEEWETKTADYSSVGLLPDNTSDGTSDNTADGASEATK